MGKEEFAAYLHATAAPAADAAVRQAQYRAAVEELFGLATGWLAGLDGVSWRREERQLEEEQLGAYDVEALCVTFRAKHVWLEPAGTEVIGAHGRVDIRGVAGVVWLLLVEADAERLTTRRLANGRALMRPGRDGGQVAVQVANDVDRPAPRLEWKLATPPPDVRFIEFDEEAFFDCLMQVLNA